MKNLLILINILFALSIVLPIETTDTTGDLAEKSANLKKYFDTFSTLTKEEDPNDTIPPEKYKLNEQYPTLINRIRKPLFFIEELDIHNITYNTNVSIRFPYTFVPFGGLNMIPAGSSSLYGSRGIDFGFLFRAESILNGKVSFTALNSFTSIGSLITLAGIEMDPGFTSDNRLRFYNNAALYTTAPQHGLLYDFYNPSKAYLSKAYKKLFHEKLNVQLTDYNRTGLYYIAGFTYLLPLHDIMSNTAIKLNYSYTQTKLLSIFTKVDEYPPALEYVDQSDITISLIENINYSRLKQEKAVLTGYDINFLSQFNLPLLKEGYDRTPDFSFSLKGLYSKRIYKDFTLKTRLVGGYNYGTRENLSGDGKIRGVGIGDFTGFGYAFANIDILVPVVNINLYNVADVTLRQKVNFIIFFALFADGGVAISNDSLRVNSYDFDYSENNYLKDNRLNLPDGKNYLNYAFSAGGGLRISPYFLHFLVRIDVGVNILEAVLEKKSPSVEITLSLNDVY